MERSRAAHPGTARSRRRLSTSITDAGNGTVRADDSVLPLSKALQPLPVERHHLARDREHPLLRGEIGPRNKMIGSRLGRQHLVTTM
jgi:hypothetical protein